MACPPIVEDALLPDLTPNLLPSMYFTGNAANVGMLDLTPGHLVIRLKNIAIIFI